MAANPDTSLNDTGPRWRRSNRHGGLDDVLLWAALVLFILGSLYFVGRLAMLWLPHDLVANTRSRLAADYKAWAYNGIPAINVEALIEDIIQDQQRAGTPEPEVVDRVFWVPPTATAIPVAQISPTATNAAALPTVDQLQPPTATGSPAPTQTQTRMPSPTAFKTATPTSTLFPTRTPTRTATRTPTRTLAPLWTRTPEPPQPSNTPVPPTRTNTPNPPTAVPTATLKPATATPRPSTATARPPTATPITPTPVTPSPTPVTPSPTPVTPSVQPPTAIPPTPAVVSPIVENDNQTGAVVDGGCQALFGYLNNNSQPVDIPVGPNNSLNVDIQPPPQITHFAVGRGSYFDGNGFAVTWNTGSALVWSLDGQTATVQWCR